MLSNMLVIDAPINAKSYNVIRQDATHYESSTDSYLYVAILTLREELLQKLSKSCQWWQHKFSWTLFLFEFGTNVFHLFYMFTASTYPLWFDVCMVSAPLDPQIHFLGVWTRHPKNVWWHCLVKESPQSCTPFTPLKQSVKSWSREFPFLGIVLFFWWYRKIFVPKKVSESVSENLVPEKVSESVSKQFGTE